MLVIGSGASGLAAAVSAERAGARVAVATKGSLQSCNSAKAQGGIQAAVRRRRLARAARAGRLASVHETADMRLVEVLTGEAPSAIHWLEELGVEFTRENGGYRLARCGGAIAQAAAPGRRPHRATRSRRGCAMRGPRLGHVVRARAAARRSSRARTAGARAAASTRSTRRPSSSPPAAAATAWPRSAASSRPTIPARPAR